MVISECVYITCYACVVLVYFIIYDQRPILHVHWKFLITEFMVYFIVCSTKTSESFRILYSLNNGSVCALYLLFATIPIALFCNLNIWLLKYNQAIIQ